MKMKSFYALNTYVYFSLTVDNKEIYTLGLRRRKDENKM